MGIDFRAFSYFSTNSTNEEIISYIYKYFHSNGFLYFPMGDSCNTFERQLQSIAMNEKNNVSLINNNRSSLHMLVKNIKGSFGFPDGSNVKLFFLILGAEHINTTNPVEGQKLLEIIIKGLIKFHIDHHGELTWAGYSEDMFTYKTINSGVIEGLYWFNIIGKKYVEKIGKDLLLKAPGWQIEELDEANMLIRLSEHPHIYERIEKVYLHEYLGLEYYS